MIGGDMNEVRNMDLRNDSIPLERRKPVYEMRKKCFEIFLALITAKLSKVDEITNYPRNSKQKPHENSYLECMSTTIRKVHIKLLNQWKNYFDAEITDLQSIEL